MQGNVNIHVLHMPVDVMNGVLVKVVINIYKMN